MLESIFEKHKKSAKYKSKRLNKKIFDYYSLFICNDSDSLMMASLHTSFQKTKNLNLIKKEYGVNVYKKLKVLNSLYSCKNNILKNPHVYHDVIILFLIDYLFLLKNSKKYLNKNPISRKNALFALKLCEKVRVDKLRYQLIDKLFAIAEPKIYKNYKELLSFSKKTYKKIEKNIKTEIEKILKEKNIKVQIESRFKSLYSVHKKIIEKNILLSQVLDVIGFRIITNSNDEMQCYMIMELLVNSCANFHHKIKDYIAVPKNNGYQSIHLTVMYEEHPVELQIRTQKMDFHAKYGDAAHNSYKNSKNVY